MSYWKSISLFALVSILAVALVSCAPAQPANITRVNLPQVQQAADQSSAVKAANNAAGGSSVVPQTGDPTTGGITVVGVGQAAGTPDVVQISVGVQTDGPDLKQAMSDNSSKMNTLLAALKAAGIADKDLRTTNFSVSVENPPAGAVKGTDTSGTIYHVNNQVDATVRDVSKLSDILDKAVASGANNIYGVNFSISDPSKLVDDARTQAVADAKTRAEKLAQLEGVTLGNVISVQEVTNSAVPMYSAPMAYGIGGGGAPIQSGQQNVTVNVQVTYAIK